MQTFSWIPSLFFLAQKRIRSTRRRVFAFSLLCEINNWSIPNTLLHNYTSALSLPLSLFFRLAFSPLSVIRYRIIIIIGNENETCAIKYIYQCVHGTCIIIIGTKQITTTKNRASGWEFNSYTHTYITKDIYVKNVKRAFNYKMCSQGKCCTAW